MQPSSSPRVGVVLVNLGTPDAPTPSAVRRYLREFLSDPRVIEVPRLAWWLILNLFVLTFRPRRVAKLYASIWENGDSPMRRILVEQARLLEGECLRRFPEAAVRVLPAMTYGRPALTDAMTRLQQDGMERVVLLPLFPQYSGTSTAAAWDVLGRWMRGQRNLPALSLIKDYYCHPLYIEALAASVREHRERNGATERLLFSFHGIPESYENQGDPYPARCRATAEAVAAALCLPADAWACSFQSRFGAQRWVQPYTDVLLEEWARAGVTSVQVACPAFSADCLETLEEIMEENRETFLHAGGKRYEYIPALNTRSDHISLLLALVEPHIDAHLRT